MKKVFNRIKEIIFFINYNKAYNATFSKLIEDINKKNIEVIKKAKERGK